MIIIGVLGLVVTILVVALRTMPRARRPRLNLAISSVPLLLTMVLPVPFGLASRGSTDWARQTAVALSRAGIALSFIMFTIGGVLTLRAVKSGDRRAATLLAIDTTLAGLPAAVFTAYAAMFRLL